MRRFWQLGVCGLSGAGIALLWEKGNPLLFVLLCLAGSLLCIFLERLEPQDD